MMPSDVTAYNEVDIISRLDCPNIVKYYDHFDLVVSNEEDAESQIVYLCLVTEFCEVYEFIIR